MLSSSRRGFLAGAAAVPVAARAAPGAKAGNTLAQVAADLETYIGFGSKLAGGPGDNGAGEWIASELTRLGFAVERQPVSTPYFEPRTCTLATGSASKPVWPQPIVVTTGAEGVSGPLVRIDAAGNAAGSLKDAIALVDLPHARWSSALSKQVRDPVAAAFAAGAKAAAIITNGPTGKVIALNTDGRKPMFGGPVALLAPEDAAPFLTAAMRGGTGTLVLDGEGGRRPAFNLVGRIDRGRDKWIAISTPRSGWTIAAGERGSGIGAWLWLARWAAKSLRGYNLAFICNSGHEYEYLGAAEALKEIAPPVADTHFWLHVGANVASRDWHDLTGKQLLSPDTQRYLSVTDNLLPLARETFAGLAGLEAPYSSKVMAAGEQVEILAAGYASVAAVFGIHRHHHVATDDARCVRAENVMEAAQAFQRLVERVA